MGGYQSFLTGQPSIQYIDALEDTELFVMPRADLQAFYNEQPVFERFGRLIAENVVIGSQHRTASLLFDTPEERYLKLIAERPKVVERIPLHHIASYLGIHIGEHLGFLAMGSWTICLALLLPKCGHFSRWFATTGLLTGLLIIISVGEHFGTSLSALFGLLNFGANTLWTIWLLTQTIRIGQKR